MEIERPALCSKSRRKSAQKHTKITKRLKKPGEQFLALGFVESI